MAKQTAAAPAKTSTIFNGTLGITKETKGTVVLHSDNFGSIYVPKLLMSKPYPQSIKVTIEAR